MIKKIAITLVSFTLLVVCFFAWFMSLLGSELETNYQQVVASDLTYLSNPVDERRGKILAIVTSTGVMGADKKDTGFELTELARAFHVFQVNGFDVDIASPLGGAAPMVLDEDDMGPYDYAFLNEASNIQQIQNTLRIDQVDAKKYDAVYFVGGKGTMFDFPDNPYIQQIVKDFSTQGKVIAAVCHGPAAFVNIMTNDGKWFVENRKIAAFSNDEELFLIPNANNLFPFLLQSKLLHQGAQYIEGKRYLNHVVVDGNLVTGQNPWSVWQLSEKTIIQLGYEPLPRPITAEEHSINVLGTYASLGYEKAQQQLRDISSNSGMKISRSTLAVHAVVALIEWNLKKAFDVLRLLNSIKEI